DCFGVAQLGFVVAGGGQDGFRGDRAFGQFAQLGGRQVQAEAEVACQLRVAVDEQFGAGAGAVGGGGGDQGAAAGRVESGQARLDAADAAGQGALESVQPRLVICWRGGRRGDEVAVWLQQGG